MKKKRPAGRSSADPRRSVDQDGVVKVELRQGERDRWAWVLGLAAVVALVGLAFFLWGKLDAPQVSEGRSPQRNDKRPEAAMSEGERAPARAAPRSAVQPKTAADPAAPIAGSEAADEPGALDEPEAPPDDGQEQAAREQPAHERAGLGSFPAPGTKPIKRGIVVPDDFPLPPGYMRHFQATDKGQMLRAILMFHPDHKPLDAAGNPVPLPADRIVPPEMAPPGLPVELLEIPKDAYANSEEDGADTAQ